METFNYVPQTITKLVLPWEQINIMPIGDVQAGTPACDLDLLERNIEEGLKADAYFVGMGDYLDTASPSNRAAWKQMNKYDSFELMMDEKMLEEEDKLFKVLAPTKGKWLGLLTGHHYWKFMDGTTTDTHLCTRLGTKHLGDCSMFRLQFQKPEIQKDSISCVIWAHHGDGAGASIGAPLAKLERVMQWAEADIYLMGHQHKLVSAPIPRFYLTPKGNLFARQKRLVATGSYLKGYIQGGTTYVEKKLLTPVSLGSPLIHITPVRREKHGETIRELIIKATT